jgi:hypothetical protein
MAVDVVMACCIDGSGGGDEGGGEGGGDGDIDMRVYVFILRVW